MPFTPGQQLAHYRIDRKIGEGGMGEVWAATDTRLNRPAAIKALPPALAGDPERLARFKREAQLLASLSHPNIAGIYGLEQVGDDFFLALELVEGDDLSTRIGAGALPRDEAVDIALQIAAALEQAHETGIVHRDLKPANIKLAADGRVKVLDFGLAKALTGDAADGSEGADPSLSPTLTSLGTQAGMILGTAGYMSPEQARGKRVDRRADVWAFGVILFEMLSGRQLYTGETATDIIAQVVTRDPDWEQLPADTPQALLRLLRRCLQRDPRNRLRDVGDAALELRDVRDGKREIVAAASERAPASPRRAWIGAAVGLALGLLAATAIWNLLQTPPPEVPLTWSTLSPPAGTGFMLSRMAEISPDGLRVVFVAALPEGGEPVLWVRELSEERARPLAGTEEAYQPFWSPDSRSVGFFTRRKLRRIDVDGGVATTLADAGLSPRGASWGSDGTILYSPDWNKPLMRVSAEGGNASVATTLAEERLELSHRWPHLLPDGKHFLYYAVSTYPAINPDNPAEVDRSGLYVGSLDGAEPRMLQAVPSRAAYRDGRLFYVDDGLLMARPFDLASLTFTGDPVALVADVTQSAAALWGAALFSVSDGGTMLFARGVPERRSLTRMQWFDREGHALGVVGEADAHTTVQISHQGTQVIAAVGDPEEIWIHDLERGTATRFTFDPGSDSSPVWSPDGKRVLFQSTRLIPGQRYRPFNLFVKETSGLGEAELLPLTDTRLPSVDPADWSPDGTVAAIAAVGAGTGADIGIYSFATGDVTPFLASESDEVSATFSPDGNWLAYSSDESGEYEIYVQAYPGPGGKWQLSRGGGKYPAWRADGRELFYFGADAVMSVGVETAGGFRHDTPRALFEVSNVHEASWVYRPFDAMPDGRRFLLLTSAEDESAEGSLTLVQGWRALLD
jgi:Tol biopolymer transport system component